MRNQPLFWAYVALAAVCIFWGATYLGIRMALESFPPVAVIAMRYIVSGSALLAAARATNARLPSLRDALITAFFGILVLGVGNAGLVYAELWIPSGLAAIFITLQPFWMVGMEAALPGGERLHGPTLAGMLVGFAGTMLLVAPSAIEHGFGGLVLRGFLMLQLACLGWSLGSMLQRRHETRAHPVVNAGIQQLATGLVYVVPTLLFGRTGWRPTTRGVGAMLYLVIFGGIIGYSAYIYALDKLPVSVVTLYSYVNPVVALLLGWLFYDEPVGWREILAMAIIFAGVYLVKRFSGEATRQSRTPLVPPTADLGAGQPRKGA